MRIIYMGTPSFAAPILKRLIESDHDISLVVTKPDRPAGRGRAVQAPPVKELALAHGLTVAQPVSVRKEEFFEMIRGLAPDVIVVAAYGKILPEALLKIPRYGCINVHASLLPRYRGAAPINWAIIRGETETGVTIMQMDVGMDTGDILDQEAVEILDDDDALSIGQALSVLGAERLMQVLARLEQDGKVQGRPQDESQATHAPMLKKEDGRIEWKRRSDEVICLIRGVYPWPGGFTSKGEEILKILRVELAWESLVERMPVVGKIPPGKVVLIDKQAGFVVRTGDGFLLVTQAQPAGKRPMSGVDLVNGGYVKEGDQLGEREEPVE